MSSKQNKSARFGAIETLLRLERTRYPVKPLFDSVSGECELSGPERGLAMNLVYGVLRQKEYLDLLITTLCTKPINKLDAIVHQALAVGLYQIFCLDRIPESAAVNETVNALKAAKTKKHLQGFVNGVLRAAIRKREQLPQPTAPSSPEKQILNHPAWMTTRWEKRFGKEEMERICKINSREPQLVIRVNSNRISRDELLGQFKEAEIGAHPGKYAPDSLVLPDYHGSIPALPGYHEGFFQVQDEAAQLVTLLLGPFKNNVQYLDACAGLGGKTGHLLQLVHGLQSEVVAVEPEPQRSRLLQENIARLSPEQLPLIKKSSLQDFRRTSRKLFHGVLVDAPCSGTGVTGRHPDIRWNRIENDLKKYQAEQLEILTHSGSLVAPGGILVYATCSLEEEENSCVVKQFLAENSDFSMTDCVDFLPSQASALVQDGFFQPHPDESIDGFFAARLQRSSS